MDEKHDNMSAQEFMERLRDEGIRVLGIKNPGQPTSWYQEPEETGAKPGPGQSGDNWVHKMSCGHEYDSSIPIPVGYLVKCSQHGEVRITLGYSDRDIKLMTINSEMSDEEIVNGIINILGYRRMPGIVHGLAEHFFLKHGYQL